MALSDKEREEVRKLCEDSAQVAGMLFDAFLAVPLANSRGIRTFSADQAFELTRHLMKEALDA